MKILEKDLGKKSNLYYINPRTPANGRTEDAIPNCKLGPQSDLKNLQRKSRSG